MDEGNLDLDGRSQKLTVETPGAPYPMEVDATRVQQIFWNPIKNAVKFTLTVGRVAVSPWGALDGDLMVLTPPLTCY